MIEEEFSFYLTLCVRKRSLDPIRGAKPFINPSTPHIPSSIFNISVWPLQNKVNHALNFYNAASNLRAYII